jgi:hypothetical protein
MLFTIPNVPLAGLILQQFYRLGNNPVTNKTIEFLALQHVSSFVFTFTVEKYLQQEVSLEQTWLGWTQENIDADLMALKVSLENQCRTVADAASTFPYHGLLATKCQAAAVAAWTSPEAAWTSPEDVWITPEDAWPSVDDLRPSAEALSSFAVAASSSLYHVLQMSKKRGRFIITTMIFLRHAKSARKR